MLHFTGTTDSVYTVDDGKSPGATRVPLETAALKAAEMAIKSPREAEPTVQASPQPSPSSVRPPPPAVENTSVASSLIVRSAIPVIVGGSFTGVTFTRNVIFVLPPLGSLTRIPMRDWPD